jgi:hypothetical protein
MRGIAVNINLQRRREEVFWRQRFHCYFSPPARRRSSDGPGFSTDKALDLLGTRLASVFYGAASRPDRGRAEKGGWNTVVGYRPQLARGGSGFVSALVLPQGNAADGRHLVAMVKDSLVAPIGQWW